jgi:hypothetical protein
MINKQKILEVCSDISHPSQTPQEIEEKLYNLTAEILDDIASDRAIRWLMDKTSTQVDDQFIEWAQTNGGLIQPDQYAPDVEDIPTLDLIVELTDRAQNWSIVGFDHDLIRNLVRHLVAPLSEDDKQSIAEVI